MNTLHGTPVSQASPQEGAEGFGHARLVFNVRTVGSPLTGVQRYVRELDLRLGAGAERVAPAGAAQGARGHLWEQCVLPLRCGDRLLFSPANTGPLAVRRQVVTIHDASTFDCPDAFSAAFGRWYRWLLPRLARRSLGIITVSEFSRERIVATMGAPREKVEVIYNGVTVAAQSPGADRRGQLRRSLGLAGRFLLFVGSRDARKNVALLSRAFSSAGLRGWELVLVGGGNGRLFSGGDRDCGHPGIRALGHVDDGVLDALYAMADGFVFPSLYEGFGLPPLEAMARGCPVLCSDAACLPEVCGPSLDRGGAPLYFSAASEGSVAEGLVRFAGLPREARLRMADAGRRRAALFTWDRCASQTRAALSRFSETGSRVPTGEARRPVFGEVGEGAR